MDAVALFFKGILGGVLLVLFAWLLVLFAHYWRSRVSGLGAVAGGWTMLMNSPFVVASLAVAFGIGFFLTVRLLSNQLR
jgi:hypothetical protein